MKELLGEKSQLSNWPRTIKWDSEKKPRVVPDKSKKLCATNSTD